MVLTTPDTIRTLQRKLYTKAKQEAAYRFYALYDKLYRADILSHAWRLVKANKGSPGVDGVNFEAIEMLALKRIKAKLTALTGRELTPIALDKIVGHVNRSLRGWANYFHYRNSNSVMEQVKFHAENRLRRHLMKRHKVKDRGIGEGRFPSVKLCARYGLYKVPTKASWRSAHAPV